ncbi:hypothetical protein BGW80DRAFT_1308826 [Lactifluus volemus]|nr:hypothetical protein BGW80DRAFT_1308826 [Lactifluus volemus]
MKHDRHSVKCHSHARTSLQVALPVQLRNRSNKLPLAHIYLSLRSRLTEGIAGAYYVPQRSRV